MKQEITIPRKETKQERAARMLDALIFGEDEKPQPPQETEQERITKMIEGILESMPDGGCLSLMELMEILDRVMEGLERPTRLKIDWK